MVRDNGMGKMSSIARLYHEFWNGLCTAYPVSAVPAGAKFPYLTYDLVQPAFSERSLQSINIYTKSESFATLWSLADDFFIQIPESGIILSLENDGGTLTLFRGNSFIQSRQLPDDEMNENIKAIYATVEILSHVL